MISLLKYSTFTCLLLAVSCGVSDQDLAAECSETQKAWSVCGERLASALGIEGAEQEQRQESLQMEQQCGQEESIVEANCTYEFMDFFDCAEMYVLENDCVTDSDIEDLKAVINYECGDPASCLKEN